MDVMKTGAKAAGLLAVGGAGLLVGWILFKPAPERAGQVVVAEPAREVKDTPKEEIAIPKVHVYQGGKKVKKDLGLPAAVTENDRQKVIASSKVPAGERAKTVTTIIDADTGRSETYVRTDPLPWLAYEDRGEIGIYVGIKNGQQAIRLQARQDLLQVKALHLGAIGSVDMAGGKTDYFVGVGVTYKW